ncbi:MAG TPA: chromate efflux transporter [Methylomirabilota bacterium]|nr:chromate efflux transporter [Methylomirabilota bacterium]
MPPSASRWGPVGEVATLFLKLGTLGFGGPAAHIALMEDEVVRRRKWLSREQFLDLLGATNLIPGPNSTEMAIHIGFVRAGWPGLLVGGGCFILPATLIVLAIAATYRRYGRLPEASWLLYGVKPVIIAVVLQALWSLGRQVLRSPLGAATVAVVAVLAAAGVNEVALLFGAALAVAAARRASPAGIGLVLIPTWGSAASAAAVAAGSAPVSLVKLTLIFLKVGSILFGSGYVLLAFLRPDLVERTGWLGDRELLDAIAVGQVTPGPVLTTATFIGYLLAGVPGALLATAAIFFPSFVFVALANPLVPKLRRSPWTAGFLDGANAASVALMAMVTWQLGRAAIVDWLAAALAVAAALLLFAWRVNSVWLIVGGAAAGLGRSLLP